MSTGAIIKRKGRLRPPILQVSYQVVEKTKSSSCSLCKITPSLYISSYEAAKNPELLSSASITHILNLAGESKCPNLLSSSYHYFSLKMPDNPKIDILFFLYFAIEIIIDSIRCKGKILVHCVKGTSRTAAVVLAYLMIQGYNEQDAYLYMNNANPNIDPNFGFVCQLKEFREIKDETRVFYYSEKYEMFVNVETQFGPRIEIVGNSCTLFLNDEASVIQRKIALQSLRLWEMFNCTSASIVYM
ncbi:hypothetical protein SteCoe_19622 [Stentor coeruleus]|uniref:protein-tyrosine-phosphatase n=1 Tax=Stentor coeruleus TaxID=5963 RepID=A0A1R2BTT9_9CILI|nr:hypothetical protein SteCoe_19622 [Stentor coeruleus]